jgi:hypothetical protein
MRHVKIGLVALAAMWCGAAQAMTAFNLHVTAVGTYGDGSIFIFVSGTIAEPYCNAARIDIPSTHPQLKTFYATAVTAFVSGSGVYGMVNGCNPTTGTPTFDTTTNSYIYLTP